METIVIGVIVFWYRQEV